MMIASYRSSLLAALAATLPISAPGRVAPAGAEPAAPAFAAIVEIDVTGERPGPRMWKVSKGDHVLWVMGTLEPLPKRMTWRSKAVEDVLEQSQEVLPSRPAFGFSWNPIAALRLYWQWRGFQKNPDHATLQQTLPPALYARFSALSFHHEVQNAVLRLAEHRRVRLHKMTLPIDDPRGLLKEIGQIPMQAQISCLETTVARLESDLSAMKARAAAWAVGDVDALRKLPLPDQQAACLAALSNSARFKDLNEKTSRAWMQGADEALAMNTSTLALKSIYELVESGGILERFRAKGYVVEGP
jgi:hypothetical protein